MRRTVPVASSTAFVVLALLARRRLRRQGADWRATQDQRRRPPARATVKEPT